MNGWKREKRRRKGRIMDGMRVKYKKKEIRRREGIGIGGRVGGGG